MSKISAFLIGTFGLSLAILIPLYLNFQIIADKIREIGVSNVFPNFWQGFALIVFVVIVSIGTLMALIVFGGGEKNVVR
jgi:energy-converting hydrogenase Eha subunit E